MGGNRPDIGACDDRSGPRRPRIERPALARLGRELRLMYDKLPPEPLPDAMLMALRSMEDADYGLKRLKEAAQALRQADNGADGLRPPGRPKPGMIRSAARMAATAWASSRQLKTARR